MTRVSKRIKIDKKLQKKLNRIGREFYEKVMLCGIERYLINLEFSVLGKTMKIDMKKLNKKAQDYFAKMENAKVELKRIFSKLSDFIASVPETGRIVRLEGENLRKWVSLQKRFHSTEIKFYIFELKFLQEFSKWLISRLENIPEHNEEFLQNTILLRAVSGVITDIGERLKKATENYKAIKQMVSS